MPGLDLVALKTAAIYMPEPAPSPVAFAAEELQRYWQAMTGARLRICSEAALCGMNVMVLGQDPTPAARRAADVPDGFTITPTGGTVTLDAASPRALLTAVYAFLEQVGCRWALDPAQEQVPRLTAAVEVRPISHAPQFALRGYCSDIMTWHYTQPEHLRDHLEEDRPFIDWMAKSGANSFFYIRHPFDTQLTIPELLPEFAQRGIAVEYGGHVIPLLLPREEYARHPEYFPQAPDGARTDHGNLCTSSAGALATASANAVRYVREHPEMSVLHIWGADLWRGGWCHCVECSSVSVQDQSVRVCNAVARALADAGIARPVCYLAYHDTIEPALTLRPDEHVTMEFAPRERCYGHALNDPECATNRRYAAALERYVELFAGRARLFEYYGDAILFAGCAVPLTQVIAADLDYYERLGIREITMLQFGAFSRWAYPLNFESFTGKARSQLPQHASAAHAALEPIMREVVTYGDIRRPPRSPDAARRVLARVEAALPRLGQLAGELEASGRPATNADAALIRYTRGVLQGVCVELQQSLAGERHHAQAQYAEALELIRHVDPRRQGVWGRVDLPIIHSFYDVAPLTE